MTQATVVDEFRQRVRELGTRPALRHKRDGRWITTTWRDWQERSQRIAAALCSHGLEPGERVALAATTQLSWVIVDVAVWLAGGVSATIYPTTAPERLRSLVADCNARFLVVDSAAHAKALCAGPPPCTVIALDGRGSTAGSAAAAAAHTNPATTELIVLPDLEREGQLLLEQAAVETELERRSARVRPQDLATIVYSSGTTGEAKGVALTHANLLFEVDAITQALALGPEDEQLLFLPLSHIFGRMLVLVQIGTGAISSFSEGLVHVLDNMLEVNPTLFASVPRLFEKIYAVTQHSAEYDGPIKQRLVRWASHVGEAVAKAEYEGKRVPRATALQHRYADRLVLSRVRSRFGSRLRFAISGGAPLSEELARWFYAAGVLVLEVYGLTECTGGATINRPDCFAFGSVGQPLAGVEVRVADDGEVWIRGPNVMAGYWQCDEATAQAVDADRWLRTGDLGEFRLVPSGAQGAASRRQRMLHITGRRKDLIVTAGGSNVAPQRIEHLLESSPWVSRAVVFGDRRPYLVALLAPDRRALSRWATERRLEVPDAALVHHPEVRGLFDTEIELVNQRLASYERIRRFALLHRELSVEDGELTDTLKVKRDLLAERHAATIAALYEEDSVV